MEDLQERLASGSKRRVRRSAEQWAELVAAQRESGLSVSAFCRARGLAVSTFHARRKRLQSCVSSEPAQRPRSLTAPRSASTAAPSPASSDRQRFVRLRVSGAAEEDNGHGLSQSTLPVVVRFVDGVELHVDAQRLGELLTLLRDRPADRPPDMPPAQPADMPMHQSLREEDQPC